MHHMEKTKFLCRYIYSQGQNPIPHMYSTYSKTSLHVININLCAKNLSSPTRRIMSLNTSELYSIANLSTNTLSFWTLSRDGFVSDTASTNCSLLCCRESRLAIILLILTVLPEKKLTSHEKRLTLLHLEWPKLYGVLAILNAIGLWLRSCICISICPKTKIWHIPCHFNDSDSDVFSHPKSWQTTQNLSNLSIKKDTSCCLMFKDLQSKEGNWKMQSSFLLKCVVDMYG